MRCPRCGEELPTDGSSCISCGKTPPKQHARGRLGRNGWLVGMVFIVVAIVVAAILLGGSRPSSQRYIVSATDLGGGWRTSSPSSPPEGWNINGSDNSAYEGMSYKNETSRSGGAITLAFFSTTEQANDTYLDMLANFLNVNRNNWSAVNISQGDRAVIVSVLLNQTEVYERLLFMQKGNAVVEMYMVSYAGPVVTISQIEEVARIQAEKIP